MPRPARRTILRLLVLLSAIAAGTTALLHWLNPNHHLEFITAKAGALIDAQVSLAAIDWGLDDGFWLALEGLTIRHSSKLPTDIVAARIYARAALAPLLKGKLVIEQVAIERPQVTYRLLPPAPPSETDDDSDDDSGGFHLPLSLIELSLSQGTLLLEDHISRRGNTVTHAFDTIAITLRQLATGQALEFALTANVPGDPAQAPQHRLEPAAPGLASAPGQLHFSGHLAGIHPRFVWRDPWLDASLHIDRLPLDSLNGYLHASAQQPHLAGRLDGQLDYRGNFSTDSASAVSLDLGAIRYRNRQLWPQDIPQQPLRVSARLRQQPGQLDLEQLEVHSGALRINAQTTLQRASRQLNDSVLSANLPLGQLADYIPWPLLGAAAQPLQNLLNGNPGVATVHRVELPAIPLGQPLAVKQLLAHTRGQATVHNVSVALGPDQPTLEHLRAQLNLADNTLHGSATNATIGALRLPRAHFSARQLNAQPQIDATLQGPLHISALPVHKQRQLLRWAGLEQININKLELRSELSLKAHYDHAKPEQWQADGHLDIATLRLSASAPKTTLSAQGQVQLRRQRRLNLLIPAFSGRLNRSPFTLSGQLFGLGEADLLADMRLKLDRLQLQPLAPWLAILLPSPLAPQRLGGHLSTDMSVYYRHDQPAKTRLRGPLSLYHGQLDLPKDSPLAPYLPPQGLSLQQINATLALTPQRYRIDHLSLKANQQLLQLSGNVLNPQQPQIKLSLQSPALDLDQLLPAAQPDKPRDDALMATELIRSEQATKRSQTTSEPVPQRALPALAKRARAQLDVAVASGRYRGEKFHSLSLGANYRHGVIDRAKASLRIADGHIGANGSADLRQLTAIPLTLNYQLEQIDLARLTRLFSADGKELASGQLNSTGKLRSNTLNLKRHLRGDFTIRTGPGKIPNRSVAANTLFSIMSVIRIQGILSGDITSGVAIDGLPYEQLAVDGRFTGGGVELEPLELITAAFSTRTIGNINLMRKDMNLDAAITVLVTIDKLLGLIPLVGPAAADLTKVYLQISGPFSEPKVRVQPAEGLKESAQRVLRPSFNATLMNQ